MKLSLLVYPAVLLTYGCSLSLLPTMVDCLQSGLQVLTKSFCNVEVLENAKDNVIIDRDGELKLKTSNYRVELPYTYLIAWYVVHCPSLMSVVCIFKNSMPFI